MTWQQRSSDAGAFWLVSGAIFSGAHDASQTYTSQARHREPFRRILDGDPWLRNESHDRPRVILQGVHNRTLEVWGSIPHGSTRKDKTVRRDAGRFVFGLVSGPFRSVRDGCE